MPDFAKTSSWGAKAEHAPEHPDHRALLRVGIGDQLKPWLTRSEVLDLTRWSAATLHSRIRDGTFPKPITRGRWVWSEVEQALNGRNAQAEQPSDVWSTDRDAIAEARITSIRRRARSA